MKKLFYLSILSGMALFLFTPIAAVGQSSSKLGNKTVVSTDQSSMSKTQPKTVTEKKVKKTTRLANKQRTVQKDKLAQKPVVNGKTTSVTTEKNQTITEGTAAAETTTASKPKHFYLLGQVGYGTQDVNSNVKKIFGVEILGITSDVKSGIAGGGHLGYRVNKWVNFEIGGMKYSDAKLEQRFLIFKKAGGVVKSYDIDLLAVLNLPLEHGLSLFAKAGPALVHSSFHVPILLKDNVGHKIIPSSFDKSRTALRPEIGAGFGFNPNKVVGVEIAYYIIFEQKGTIKSDYLPELDCFGLGLKLKL